MILAGELPDIQADALIVLRLTKQLVTDFLADPDPEPAQKSIATIVRIRGATS